MDDDVDYDVLPSTIRPVPPSLNNDDDDTYDYLTTKNDDVPTVAMPDDELYDFIRPRDSSEGDWSDDVARRTSTIVPDIDDDMYDYIVTHEQQPTDGLFVGGGEVADNVHEGAACIDELYDYPPLRSSPEAAATDDDGSEWPTSSAIAAVVENKHASSLSSSSSSGHYDVLPTRTASSSDHQLSVRKSSASESATDVVGSTGQDLYDFFTPKDASKSNRPIYARPAVSSEGTDYGGGGARPGSATTVDGRQKSSDDDYYDVLPATVAVRPSVHRTSGALADSTASTGTPPLTGEPPEPSSSTLLSSSSDHQDVEQMTNTSSGDVTASDTFNRQLLQTFASSAENESYRKSKLAIYTV